MKVTVKQHYVPQFYLRNFGEVIFGYDKKNQKPFKTTPKNVAFEPDFYGPDFDDKPSIEKLMAQMERGWSVSVKKLIEKENFYQLAKTSQTKIINFMTFQILRTKQFRQDIVGMANHILNLYAKSRGLKKPVKLSKTSEIKQQINMFKSFPTFAGIIQQMKFSIVVNKTPIPFWTSDNPINLQNDIPQIPWGNMGLACRGIEVHLPLTPKLAIVAVDPITFSSAPERFEMYAKRLAKRENYHQVLNSTRFLFSNVKKFQFIQEMFEFSPEAKNPDKVRFDLVNTKLGKKDVTITVPKNLSVSGPPKTINALDTWLDPDYIERLKKINDEMIAKGSSKTKSQ